MCLTHLVIKNDMLKKIDSRCRIISAFVLTLSAIELDSVFLLCGIVVFFMTLLVCGGNTHTVLERLAAVNVFVVFLAASVILTVKDGVFYAALLSLRINAAALIFIFFVSPLDAGLIANALLKLKVNKKLVSLFVLTNRYIFVMSEKIFSSVRALEIRKNKNITTLQLWRCYGSLFASSLYASIQRSENVSKALMLQNWNGSFPLTTNFLWKLRDSVFLALVVFAAAAPHIAAVSEIFFQRCL